MPSSLRPVKSFDSAVAALGGTSKAAEALGYQPPAICQWRVRHKKRFPAELYFVVQTALQREGRSAPVRLFTFERARAG
jgi:DNA-binding transcriptional regulator YdaS (Cro superfamily)